MRTVFALLLASSALFAIDVTGTWTGKVAARGGATQDVYFKFIQKNGIVTGKMYNDNGSTPITEGKIEDHNLSFTVVIQEQVGNLFNETRLIFKGCVDGNDIQLTREREITVAVDPGTNPNRASNRQSIGIQRLF